MYRRFLVFVRYIVVSFFIHSGFAHAGSPEDYGGLPEGDAQVEVYGLCSACHSLMIVQQQGLSKNSWLETLEWMTEEQGMAELPDDMMERIASYLSEHYGVDN